jgi:hypothetical protein
MKITKAKQKRTYMNIVMKGLKQKAREFARFWSDASDHEKETLIAFEVCVNELQRIYNVVEELRAAVPALRAEYNVLEAQMERVLRVVGERR